MTLRIAVYSIAKNEEQFVGRWVEAAQDADVIVLADTGSTDNTVRLAEVNGVQVHHISINPWRFDHARNAALSLVPTDIDVCFSVDLDEVLQPGWRAEIERLWKDGVTRIGYHHDWGMGARFTYDHIHARNGYYWRPACHEDIYPDPRTKEIWVFTDKLLTVHKPDATKSRSDYIDLLKVSVDEYPDDPRSVVYYARELAFKARWQESIDAFSRYLAMSRANWINERDLALRWISRCYQELGDKIRQEQTLWQAVKDAPQLREPWCGLAMFMYQQSRWLECFDAAIKAIAVTQRPFVYTDDPICWGAQPYDLAAIAAWNLGKKEEAVVYAKKAIEIEPNDARLKANLAAIEDGVVTVKDKLFVSDSNKCVHKFPPLVCYYKTNKHISVLRASMKTYAPEIEVLLFPWPKSPSVGENFNRAMRHVFKYYYEVMFCNDDVVVGPDSVRLLLEDVAFLKARHGDKLGIVSAWSDSNRRGQTVTGNDPHPIMPVRICGPVFAWISKMAFKALGETGHAPISWFGEDVMCEDLNALGFQHYICRSYVHHVGGSTVGSDHQKLIDEAGPWLEANRSQYIERWGLKKCGKGYSW
jgi:tetratricopeptide (TPR) repeat protein